MSPICDEDDRDGSDRFKPVLLVLVIFGLVWLLSYLLAP
jgi:hypothetical protein